jgi:hypothetical protein
MARKRLTKLQKVSKEVTEIVGVHPAGFKRPKGKEKIRQKLGRESRVTREFKEQTQTNLRSNKGGRPPGSPNRLPTLLKDALIEAATNAGLRLKEQNNESKDGLVRYLTHQAAYNPQSFLPLLGKVLPLQIDTGGSPILQVQNIEIVVLQPGDDPGSHKAGLVEIDGTAEVVADGDGDPDGDG